MIAKGLNKKSKKKELKRCKKLNLF